MLKFYKVVTTSKPQQYQLPGLFSSGARYEFCLKYTPNRWRLPAVANSKLAVFGSLKAAKDFACLRGQPQIWECEVRNPTPPACPRLVFNDDLANEDMKRYWQLLKQNRESARTLFETRSWPEDTYLVDAIKLTKKVE